VCCMLLIDDEIGEYFGVCKEVWLVTIVIY